MNQYLFWHFILRIIVKHIESNNDTRKVVCIYHDKGVSKTLLHLMKNMVNIVFSFIDFNVKYVTAEDVINGELEQSSVFIMPGGADKHYMEALGKEGNKKIKDFVSHGGVYIGICAGAYYACSSIEFDKDGELEIIEPRDLGFFPGVAVGPVFGPYSYDDDLGERVVNVSINVDNKKINMPMHFNGGPYFQNADQFQNVKVIGTYSITENEQPYCQTLGGTTEELPAILLVEHFKGIAILMGIHPEVVVPKFY